VIDEKRCTGCGECSRFCEYNALAVIQSEALVFPELCHSCGGCALVCPAGAIYEAPRQIGRVELAASAGVTLVTGRSNIGQPMMPPIIRAVKKHVPEDRFCIIDCPPGTSCAMTTAIAGSDVAIFVTEPTPFGLCDLDLAAQVATTLGIPFRVVMNREDLGTEDYRSFCSLRGYQVIQKLPNDRRIAEVCSEAGAIFTEMPEYRQVFSSILSAVTRSEVVV